MKNSSLTLAPILECFFVERLMNQQRVSKETVLAYRDTFRLLLKFAQRELGKTPSKLFLEDLDASLICNFLNYLEEERHNMPRTRNHRDRLAQPQPRIYRSRIEQTDSRKRT